MANNTARSRRRKENERTQNPLGTLDDRDEQRIQGLISGASDLGDNGHGPDPSRDETRKP